MTDLVTDPEIADRWSIRPLKYLTTVNDETLKDAHPDDASILYLDIGCVGRGSFVEEPEEMLFGDAPSRARRVVAHGDVVVSTVRTYLRAVARIENPPANLIASTGFAVIRPQAGVDSRYLYYWCLSDHFIETVVSKSVGVSYPAINATQLLDIPMALPDIAEQCGIADYLDAQMDRIDRLTGGVPTLGWGEQDSLVSRFVAGVRLRQRALLNAAMVGRIGA